MHAIANLLDELDLVLSYLEWRGPAGWVRLFWLYVAIDFPRYVLTALLVSVLPVNGTRSTRARAQRWLRTRPRLTVIVPVLNEADTIAATVQSLSAQTYPVHEIIVVDDGSTDGSAEIGRSLIRSFPNLVFYSTGSRNGKSAALNLGLAHASGDFIMFVDSDTTFDPKAVENALGRFSDPRVVAVGGNLRVRNTTQSVLCEMQAIEYLTTINIGRRWKGLLGVLPVVSGAFGLFRADMVRRVGGMDPGPGLDSDLTIDMQKTGGRVVFAPNAICYTKGPTRWKSLIQQRLRWSRNSVRNRWRKHRNLFLPWLAGFRPRMAFVHADTILFQTVFVALSLVYVLDVAAHFPGLFLIVLLSNHVLYAISESLSLLLAAANDDDPRSVLRSLLYVPLYHWYRWVLKLVLVTAQLQELLWRMSYRESFTPAKVRPHVPRW